MKKLKSIIAIVLVFVMAVTILPAGELIVLGDEEVPGLTVSLSSTDSVFNDFEGETAESEITLENIYNSTVGLVSDDTGNHAATITTSSTSGVTFSGLWHYAVIAPDGADTFDASSYADDGGLTFAVYGESSTRVYVGVKTGDSWYSYQGYTNSSSSTQSAGRTSGRLQDNCSAGEWTKYIVKLSDFDITDWSEVQAVAIGFYATGTYYIDNIAFTDDEEVTTYRYEAEDMQLNHMRFPTTSGVGSGEAVGVYWSNDSEFRSDLEEDSYARLVVNAEYSGTYEISMDYYAGSYPFRIYVNGDLQIDETLSGNNWSLDTADFELELTEGKNVIVFAVAAWGCFDCVYLPSTVTVVESENTEEYYATDALLQAVYLEPFDSVFDPEAQLYTGTLDYDTDDEYISKVTYDIDAEEGQSMTLYYYISEFNSDDTATLECAVNDNAKFTIDLDGDSTDTEYSVTVDANTMEENGLMEGENTIIIYPSADDSEVGIYYMTIDDDDSYTPVDKTTLSGVELEDYITYRGRSMEIDDSVTFDWSGSGFAFNYDGGGDIVATITSSGSSSLRIAVYVDDEDRTTTDSEARVVKTLSSGTTKVVLAKNLGDGHHTIEVLKCTEANGSLAQLDSITFESSGEISKWKDASYNMMVIGGSVSCGNQIYTDGTEDASLSYVANLALAYNMDWNTISCSGRGLIQGYNSEDGWVASTEKQLNTLYEYTSYFRDSETLWNYEDFVPDVIIVNAGGNDLGSSIMSTLGTTVDDFCDAVVEFSTKLRQQYPDSLILWFYGVYVNRDYKDEYQAAVDSLEDENIQLVYTPQMDSGADSHPDVTEHVYLAQIFSSYISEFLDVENPMDEYDPYTAPELEIEDSDMDISVYNDFEGDNASSEISLENTYNTNLAIEQDHNLNHELLVKIGSGNGDGVNFNGLWHYGVISPKDSDTIDATAYVEDGKLVFYVYSDTSSNVYLGVKTDDEWHAYQGYTSSSESTQASARSSGRLQDTYTAGSWQKYEVELSDFDDVDWSAVQGIAIGFYTSGNYYVDNIQFEKEADETAETTSSQEETEDETTVTEFGDDSNNSDIESVTTTSTSTTEGNKTSGEDSSSVSSTSSSAGESNVSVARTKVKKARRKKSLKKIKVVLKKISGASFYKVQISKKKKFKKKNIIFRKKIVKNKKTIKSTKLKKKYKKLYIRARAVAVVNGKKYKGKWSKAKKVKG